MKISKKDWLAYIDKLSLLDRTAADKMRAYVNLYGVGDADALVDYAYGIATKYGEGSAALSAEMYDLIAELSGKHLPPAEPAPTPEYDEVAKTVYGTKKNVDVMADAVGRLVKRTGADTTVRNAIRDGAYWAWIPNGDTCAFCITLASRGWQEASKKALRNGHAEHIHSHCDCAYAVSFDEDTKYGDYDPDRYLEMYENVEGSTSKDKINALRRQKYQQDKDRINAQKREAYAKRVDKNGLTEDKKGDTIFTKMHRVSTDGHRNEISLTAEQKREAYEAARRQGFKGSIDFSDNMNTSVVYFPSEDGTRKPEDALLVIGTDAFPNKDGKTANDLLTVNCCMAHETVGHYEAWIKWKDQEDKLLEEVQASIRASKYGVGLSEYERELLMEDAMDRLKKWNINYDGIVDRLNILER